MIKLLFKSRKNENNTDISIFQIYSPNFYQNILKFYRLNSFKEIAIHGI